MVKSVLRGVWNFTAVPEYAANGKEQWYPNPSSPTPDATMDEVPANFNLYNLDPYVWFVHDVQGLTGYAFSVDDDVAILHRPAPSWLRLRIRTKRTTTFPTICKSLSAGSVA